ncbi:MAG: SoxR reducing system RseC family protein [Gammaproteobacteria bacterium]|nr:SoxR reducing system RseC family protein [Gammaproteobacteria bacterium]MCK5262591.1 SoxR reducing system RseC family protein [Gammaproteobacteria bacterium]
MIEQEVQIIAVEADRLLVEAERRSSCQSCAVKSGCGTSVLAKWFDKKHLRFYVDKPVDSGSVKFVEGDRVQVGLQESALTQGALTVYLLPLLAMIAVALLADSSLSTDFYWRDLVIAASAFAGLVLALFAGRLYFHLGRSKQRFNPVLLTTSVSKSPSEKS